MAVMFQYGAIRERFPTHEQACEYGNAKLPHGAQFDIVPDSGGKFCHRAGETGHVFVGPLPRNPLGSA